MYAKKNMQKKICKKKKMQKKEKRTVKQAAYFSENFSLQMSIYQSKTIGLASTLHANGLSVRQINIQTQYHYKSCTELLFKLHLKWNNFFFFFFFGKYIVTSNAFSIFRLP